METQNPTPGDAGELAANAAGVQAGGQTDAGAPGAEQATPAAKSSKAKVQVRLLRDCEHGRCNDLVALLPAAAELAVKSGVADDSKAAVKYAAGLEQNQASEG